MRDSTELDCVAGPRAVDRLRRFAKEIALSRPGARTILFGEAAKGRLRRDNVITVAVVLDGEPDRAERNALTDLAFGHVLDGWHIVPMAISAARLAEPTADDRLAREVDRDGIEIA